MPSNYAHHRFGQQCFELLPSQSQKTIRRFPQLYTIGLHGPDLFFYYNPFARTAMGSLGREYHEKSGLEYFTEVAGRWHLHPTEGAQSYLWGLLSHYCLDSVCHPFVHEKTDHTPIGHTELEVEFDRFLMVLDGIDRPQTQDFSSYFRLTRGECVTVSEFFPPATAAAVHIAAGNTRLVTKYLAIPNRKFLQRTLAPFGENIRQQMILSPANHKCMHLNNDLLDLYGQALERFPVLLQQLTDHLETAAPLGEEFAPKFG